MHRLNALTKVAPAQTVIAGMIRGASENRGSIAKPISQPALSGRKFSLPCKVAPATAFPVHRGQSSKPNHPDASLPCGD